MVARGRIAAERELDCMCTEECESKRDFREDCFDLLISPFHMDLLHDATEADVDQLVHGLFPANVPLEKHTYV